MENCKNFQIIRDVIVNAPSSLLTIPSGETVTVDVAKSFSLSTARSAASRLNNRVGWKEFKVATPDNGATLHITRRTREEVLAGPWEHEAIKQ